MSTLKTRSWDTDKGKQYKTEIVAESVQFGPYTTKPKGDDINQRPPQERAAAAKPAPPVSGVVDYPEDINPDDIPF